MPPTRRLVAALVAYAALLLLSLWLLGGGRFEGSTWRFAIALMPVPAAVAIVAVGMSVYRGMDELLQRIHLMALAVSFLGTVVSVFSWGFLEGVGLPRLSGFVVFGVLVAGYLVGLAWARSRYR